MAQNKYVKIIAITKIGVFSPKKNEILSNCKMLVENLNFGPHYKLKFFQN